MRAVLLLANGTSVEREGISFPPPARLLVARTPTEMRFKQVRRPSGDVDIALTNLRAVKVQEGKQATRTFRLAGESFAPARPEDLAVYVEVRS